jgi:CheY-like chemotaxis protein
MDTDSEHRPSLLLVDDEARVLSALQRALRREGWLIVAAESSREALEILESCEFDVVLSDQKMPGMSGVELLGRIAESHPSTVRFLLTGWSEAISQEALSAAGVEQVISKPWDDVELKTLLRRHLGSGISA